MNYDYRKKPVVIQSFQMTQERRNNNVDWPNWLHEAWNTEPGEGSLWIDPCDPERQRLVVGTLEGVARVEWGDWIIRGVKNEIYPCKSDIFEATYEPPGVVNEIRRQFSFAMSAEADTKDDLSMLINEAIADMQSGITAGAGGGTVGHSQFEMREKNNVS